jgi:parvulin-like peptidyl-prolyl isomerase
VQADIENKIKEQMLMYNVIDYKIRSKILIRPEEVTAFYNNNKDDFVTPEERQLQVIALENEDLAKSFSYALRTGEKLEDLATRYPLTLNKLNVRRPSELRKDVEDLVFNLGITEVSEPVQIDDKFYVFKLDNIIPSKPISLIEAQDKINDFLFQKKMQEDLMRWLDELKKQSYIKIF